MVYTLVTVATSGWYNNCTALYYTALSPPPASTRPFATEPASFRPLPNSVAQLTITLDFHQVLFYFSRALVSPTKVRHRIPQPSHHLTLSITKCSLSLAQCALLALCPCATLPYVDRDRARRKLILTCPAHGPRSCQEHELQGLGTRHWVRRHCRETS